jgi:uncharacterized protein YndB with AHSA1/START domain
VRIHTSMLVHRPIEVVFEYLSSPKHLPGWVTGLARADSPLADEQEVGTLLALERSAERGRVLSTWEVTAYEPPRSLALRGLDDGAAALEVRWTLQGIQPGDTRVCVEADVAMMSFFQLPPADLESIGIRRIQHDLDLLRQRLETEDVDR